MRSMSFPTQNNLPNDLAEEFAQVRQEEKECLDKLEQIEREAREYLHSSPENLTGLDFFELRNWSTSKVSVKQELLSVRLNQVQALGAVIDYVKSNHPEAPEGMPTDAEYLQAKRRMAQLSLQLTGGIVEDIEAAIAEQAELSTAIATYGQHKQRMDEHRGNVKALRESSKRLDNSVNEIVTELNQTIKYLTA